MKIVGISETLLLIYQSTWRIFFEDAILLLLLVLSGQQISWIYSAPTNFCFTIDKKRTEKKDKIIADLISSPLSPFHYTLFCNQ